MVIIHSVRLSAPNNCPSIRFYNMCGQCNANPEWFEAPYRTDELHSDLDQPSEWIKGPFMHLSVWTWPVNPRYNQEYEAIQDKVREHIIELHKQGSIQKGAW